MPPCSPNIVIKLSLPRKLCVSKCVVETAALIFSFYMACSLLLMGQSMRRSIKICLKLVQNFQKAWKLITQQTLPSIYLSGNTLTKKWKRLRNIQVDGTVAWRRGILKGRKWWKIDIKPEETCFLCLNQHMVYNPMMMPWSRDAWLLLFWTVY